MPREKTALSIVHLRNTAGADTIAPVARRGALTEL